MKNQTQYHQLCLTYIQEVLLSGSTDGSIENDIYEIFSVNPSKFQEADVQKLNSEFNLSFPLALKTDCDFDADFAARNAKGSEVYFYFFEADKEAEYKTISSQISKLDDQEFKKICCMIVPDKATLNACREPDWADFWQRGFFVDFKELENKVAQIAGSKYSLTPQEASSKEPEKPPIHHFSAEILSNQEVGVKSPSKHYRMILNAPLLGDIVPGQFVMIDTVNEDERNKIEANQPRLSTSISQKDIKKLEFKTPYLKRPFGIHRAFYEHFELGYLKSINLPKTLASITHIVRPDRFELLYKVIPDGTGTNALTKLKVNDQIKVLGPLGKAPNLGSLGLDRVKEVHLIGGGVGMAPLVFFGQALKYYSCRLKAFIGIDCIDTLLDSSTQPDSTCDALENEFIHIEEMAKIGLTPHEIFLSCDMKSDTALSSKISAGNYSTGVVTAQYESYLKQFSTSEEILIISCGPEPMLAALNKIVSKHSNIKMKVLLEKRMGCGIGVCMSCVCRTKKNGSTQYSCVCTEGPFFDSQDIDWNN